MVNTSATATWTLRIRDGKNYYLRFNEVPSYESTYYNKYTRLCNWFEKQYKRYRNNELGAFERSQIKKFLEKKEENK